MRDLNAKVMAGDKQPLGAGEEYWPSSDEAKFAFSEMKSQLEAGAPRGLTKSAVKLLHGGHLILNGSGIFLKSIT